VCDIADKVLELLGKPADMRTHVPERLGQVDRHIGSTEKAERLLGWRARTSFEDGLERMYANAQKQGVTGKASFIQADLFQTDLSKPTVITMFLLPSINMKLRPTLLNLKPGTRIVSNTFDMEDWQPDETASIGPEGCTSWCKALLWIVPAKAEGRWKTPQGELNIVQKFQMITGTLGSTPINGKVVGDQITFTAGSTKHTGRVNGKAIEGGTLSATKI